LTMMLTNIEPETGFWGPRHMWMPWMEEQCLGFLRRSSQL